MEWMDVLHVLMLGITMVIAYILRKFLFPQQNNLDSLEKFNTQNKETKEETFSCSADSDVYRFRYENSQGTMNNFSLLSKTNYDHKPLECIAPEENQYLNKSDTYNEELVNIENLKINGGFNMENNDSHINVAKTFFTCRRKYGSNEDKDENHDADNEDYELMGEIKKDKLINKSHINVAKTFFTCRRKYDGSDEDKDENHDADNEDYELMGEIKKDKLINKITQYDTMSKLSKSLPSTFYHVCSSSDESEISQYDTKSEFSESLPSTIHPVNLSTDDSRTSYSYELSGSIPSTIYPVKLSTDDSRITCSYEFSGSFPSTIYPIDSSIDESRFSEYLNDSNLETSDILNKSFIEDF